MLPVASLPRKAIWFPSGDQSANRPSRPGASSLVAGDEPSVGTMKSSKVMSHTGLVGKMRLVPSGDHVRSPRAQYDAVEVVVASVVVLPPPASVTTMESAPLSQTR